MVAPAWHIRQNPYKEQHFNLCVFWFRGRYSSGTSPGRISLCFSGHGTASPVLFFAIRNWASPRLRAAVPNFALPLHRVAYLNHASQQPNYTTHNFAIARQRPAMIRNAKPLQERQCIAPLSQRKQRKAFAPRGCTIPLPSLTRRNLALPTHRHTRLISATATHRRSRHRFSSAKHGQTHPRFTVARQNLALVCRCCAYRSLAFAPRIPSTLSYAEALHCRSELRCSFTQLGVAIANCASLCRSTT